MTPSLTLPHPLLTAPWDAPGFVRVLVLIASLLVVTAVVLAILTARGRGGAPTRTLWSRWVVWAILAPTFAAVAYAGLVPVALLMALFAIQGSREWADLTGLSRTHRAMLSIYSVVAVGLALFGTAALLATIPLLLLAAMILPVAAADTSRGMRDLAYGALGFAYLPLLLSFGVLMVRDFAHGGALLFMTAAAVAASDIGAYVAGKTIGRRRLAPRLSPNKTVGGLAGNAAGALLAIVLLVPTLAGVSPIALLVVVIVVAIGAVWGDLFVSALKREAGVKDAGHLLPGFGGLLDRIDSYIVTVPLVYYTVRVADLVTPVIAR